MASPSGAQRYAIVPRCIEVVEGRRILRMIGAPGDPIGERSARFPRDQSGRALRQASGAGHYPLCPPGSGLAIDASILMALVGLACQGRSRRSEQFYQNIPAGEAVRRARTPSILPSANWLVTRKRREKRCPVTSIKESACPAWLRVDPSARICKLARTWVADLPAVQPRLWSTGHRGCPREVASLPGLLGER